MFLNRPLLGLSLLLATASYAQETSDWKLLGFMDAKNPKEPPAMFYLVNEIKRSPTGSVQVWTKTLSGAGITKVMNTKPSDAVTSSITEKFKSGYQPPYITLRKSTDDKEKFMAIAMEVLADSGTVPPDVRMLWDFNCKESTYRIPSALSSTQTVLPQFVSQPVPPESLIHDLATQVCKTVAVSADPADHK
jgi:hypothetical protein